jgi:hypothetical protein
VEDRALIRSSALEDLQSATRDLRSLDGLSAADRRLVVNAQRTFTTARSISVAQTGANAEAAITHSESGEIANAVIVVERPDSDFVEAVRTVTESTARSVACSEIHDALSNDEQVAAGPVEHVERAFAKLQESAVNTLERAFLSYQVRIALDWQSWFGRVNDLANDIDRNAGSTEPLDVNVASPAFFYYLRLCYAPPG